MNTRIGNLFVLSALVLATGSALAQASKNQLTGGWALKTLVTDTADGRIEPFGPTPMGYIHFGANGRYTVQIMRPDLPKVAAGSHLKATPEESMTIARGQISFYGKWAVLDPKTGEVRIDVETSSLPNMNGAEQRRFATVKGDSLTLINPSSPSNGRSTLELVRVR